ncbi:MAG TPA: recombination mediator RecR [Bacteroidales bacterium]|nr:recombination mediator RecR [Bacteroidales bacterium]
MNTFPSKLVENAVNELSRLPGIGKKTAIRLSLHLLKQDSVIAEALGNSILKMRQNIKYCTNCHNISDTETCEICANPQRDHSLICVVEDVRDVMAIENTAQFHGIYHILGGIISPMEGIGPDDLNIETLVKKVRLGNIHEIVMALSSTIEGDTTNFYLYKMLKSFPVIISTIARGISVGDELEYADEVTLGRSIINRIPYENSLIK